MATTVLSVEVPEEEGDDTGARLLEAGASGAEVRDGSLLPMPDAPALPAGRARVRAFFAGREEAERAMRSLALSGALEELPDEDWGERWRRGLAPFTVGRVLVRPSWCEPPSRPDPCPPGEVEVVLDPGMAFGTGTHPTTSLCLSELDRILTAAPGSSVLDVGTGSGLLAIAARKLGAGRVVGTDNDPVALRVAGENAARNGVALELTAAPPEEVVGGFDVVVANILANTLVELAPGLAPRVAPGGKLLLSGLLAGQEDEVRRAYLAQGLADWSERDRALEVWRLLALQRIASP